MPIEVYETDISQYLAKNAELKNLSFKRGDRMLTITLNDVSDVKGNNKLLLQQVQDKAWPVVKKALPALVKEIEKADGKEDEAKRTKAANKALDNFELDATSDLIELCQSVFTDFAKDRKDYRVYKVKKGVGIAISGVSLAGSIALTAASGWSGAGSVVGVIGMTRSAASLAQQIYNLAVESEKIQARIETNIEKMRKQLGSSTIKENTAKQVASTVMNKVFAVEIETLLVTVDVIEDDLKLLSNKVKGNKVNVGNLGGEVSKIMDRQDEVAKRIDELENIVDRTNKEESAFKKLKNEQSELEKRLDRTIKDIEKLNDRISKLESWTSGAHRDIAALQSKYSGKATKAAGIATELVVAVTSFVAGDFSAPQDTIKDLHEASKRVVAGLTVAADALSFCYDSGTAIYGAIKKG